MKKYIIPILILLGLGGVVYGAPTYTLMRSILPETTSTYDLGSATKVWNNLFINNATTTSIAITGLTGIPYSNGSTKPLSLATSANLITLLGYTPISNALTKGNLLVGNDAGVAQATSSVFISSIGRFGIGTTTPYAKLSVWGSGTDGAKVMEVMNSASTTLFSIKENGDVNIGGNNLWYDGTYGTTSIASLYMGNMAFEKDSGVNSWIDEPVTSSSALGTVVGYSAKLDGNDLLTLYGLSDGAGSVTGLSVGIGTTTPISTFQATVATENATTSIQFGKANQNKGTCFTYYDIAGTPVYMYFVGITPTYTATKPSGCQN
jgi:hypothetical protein